METLEWFERLDLSEENKEHLIDFKNQLRAENISNSRTETYLSSFKRIDHLINFNLANPDKSELKKIVTMINQNEINEKDYSVWTICETKKALKKFYMYQEGCENPEIVDFIDAYVKESDKPKTDPDELIDKEEAYKIIRKVDNERDTAFFTVLWDSGARLNEILSLKWKDLRFEENIVKTKVRKGKTGERTIPLAESKEAIKEWKEKYKDPRADDYVFVKRCFTNKKKISRGAIYKKLKRTVEETDIPDYKKTNPHAWRKARATHYASQGMNQPTMNQYFGWARGSDNPVIYIRLAQRDVEKSVKNIYGLNSQEKSESKNQEIGETIEEMQQDLKKILEQ